MISHEQLAFINSRRVAHLATADAAGRPHVIPVCFAYLDGRFWIAIDEKPKRTARLQRLRNIEENPRVSLVFDRYDDDWARLGWVLVRGAAEIIDPPPAAAIAALRDRYPQYQKMALASLPAIRITPQRVTAWGDLPT